MIYARIVSIGKKNNDGSLMRPHTSQMLCSYKMLYNWHEVIDAKYSSKSRMMGSRKYFNGYCPLVFNKNRITHWQVYKWADD